MLSLQHDTGKWCTEYTWSAEDSMWGMRVLHNFGKLSTSADSADDGDWNPSPSSGTAARPKRVDEEDAVEAGLRGRISVGAEVYLSAKERSAGGQSVRSFPVIG
jgi:distribution and morphology protein 10